MVGNTLSSAGKPTLFIPRKSPVTVLKKICCVWNFAVLKKKFGKYWFLNITLFLSCVGQVRLFVFRVGGYLFFWFNSYIASLVPKHKHHGWCLFQAMSKAFSLGHVRWFVLQWSVLAFRQHHQLKIKISQAVSQHKFSDHCGIDSKNSALNWAICPAICAALGGARAPRASPV